MKDWYAKRIKSYDFGSMKFGKSIDKAKFIGRRVDCLSRGIDVIADEGVVTTMRRYLEECKT